MLHASQTKKSKKLPVKEPAQPAEIGAATDTTSKRYYHNLKTAFEGYDSTIFDDVSAIAATLGLPFHAGPNKKDARAIEKADLAYFNDFTQLKDLRRASIVCHDVASIIMLMLALESAGIDMLRIKNRFDRKYEAAKKTAGYRDLQLNVRLPGTGLIWELQIHVEAIEELKTKMRNT